MVQTVVVPAKKRCLGGAERGRDNSYYQAFAQSAQTIPVAQIEKGGRVSAAGKSGVYHQVRHVRVTARTLPTHAEQRCFAYRRL